MVVIYISDHRQDLFHQGRVVLPDHGRGAISRTVAQIRHGNVNIISHQETGLIDVMAGVPSACTTVTEAQKIAGIMNRTKRVLSYKS